MAEKRIFYITSDRLTVYWVTNNDVHKDMSFTLEDEGYANFSEYLKNNVDSSSDVLVDVMDEEFRIDTIPHLLGKDRLAVQDRKLKQMFHNTCYRGVEIQGRENTGRRDDQVLLTALTNPEPLQQWIKAMLENKVPVVGIFSLPMLAQYFVKKLHIKTDHSLLFVPQHGGMIRQIFLQNSAVKISRLLPTKCHDNEKYSKFIIKEAVKNQRYLQRLRTLSPGDTMHVYILCETTNVSVLRALCPHSDTIQYNFVSMDSARSGLGLSGRFGLGQSERFFIQLLSRNRPKINYASGEERRYYYLNQTRRAMVAASVFLLLSFISLAGQTILDGLELRQKSIDLEQKIHITTNKYNIVVSKLPNTDISPRNMQNAVHIVDTLSRHKTDPQQMMASLSRGLIHFPNVQINEIKWLSSNRPSELEPSLDQDEEPEFQSDRSLKSRYQIALVKGQLRFFRGNYKTAFRTIKKFVNTLRNDPDFIEVSTLKFPLDIDSSSTLSMTSGKGINYQIAEFEIRAVIKVDNEHA